MNDRVIVDFDHFDLDIERILDGVRTIRNDKMFLDIVGEQANQIKQWEFTLKEKQRKPFNLMVIGDFKRGKSTLINAILGKYIVPTNVLPETVTINQVRYGERETAVAILKNGKKARLNLDELNREDLGKILEELPSPVQHIEIELPHPILKEITITDTPGLGDIFQKFDSQVADYIQQADALIYVVSARIPLSMSERQFITSMSLGDSFSRMLLVVNMIDALETEENIKKVVDRTKQTIAQLVAHGQVYPLSALDEYCRITDHQRPAPDLEEYLSLQFDYFRSSIDTDIVVQKDVIRAEQITKNTERILFNIENMARQMEEVISKKTGDFDELEGQYQKENQALVENIEEQIEQLQIDIDQMYQESRKWMEEFLLRLKAEILNLQTTVTADQLQKHFQFYMMEMLQSALQICVEGHKSKLVEKINQTAMSISEIATPFTGCAEEQLARHIVDISWTGADTANIAVSVLTSNLGVIGTIGQALVGFIRQKQVRERQKDYLVPILSNYDDISEQMLDEIKGIYNHFKKLTEDTLRDFYENELEKSSQLLRQAKIISKEKKLHSDDVISYLQGVIRRTEELRSILEKYQQL